MRKLYACVLLSAQVSIMQAQWVEITSPTAGNLWTMEFFNDNLGYMNSNGPLLKTTDGGASWTTTAYAGNVDGDFSFPTSTVGYMAGFYDIIKKTTDAGATWTSVTINDQALPAYGVSFVDANTGWVVGHNGFVKRTTNGGATWTTQTVSGSAQLEHVHFVNANVGTAVGENGAIRRTTNGGSTWSGITGAAGANLQDIFFLDENIGFIVGSAGTILKTENGGVNWTALTSGTTENLATVCFRNAQEGYVAGYSGFMMKTTNGGLTWTTEDNPFFNTGQKINDMLYQAGHYLAVGDAGTITRSGVAIGIPSVEEEGTAFALSPNPASNHVNIRVPGRTNLPCKVRVYDGAGALILTTNMPGGERRMDVAELVDGLYMVEVETGSTMVRMKLVMQH